jgi:hypothetical protein
MRQLIAPSRNEPPGTASLLRMPQFVRFGLWAMALVTLVVGLQQQFAPRSFYDDFPGFGLHWVSVDGAYNEHLLRDLGGANLALAVIIFFAIARPTAGLIRAAAAAVLVAQVPHFVYHAQHLALLSTDLDRVLQTALLAITILIPIGVLIGASSLSARGPSHATTNEPGTAERRPRQLIPPAR